MDIICSVRFTCISSIVSFLILGEWLSNNFIRSFSIWDCVSNCCWCSILWRCWWECNWQRRLVLASTKDELWLSRAVFSTPSSPKKISYMSNQIAFMFQGILLEEVQSYFQKLTVGYNTVSLSNWKLRWCCNGYRCWIILYYWSLNSSVFILMTSHALKEKWFYILIHAYCYSLWIML